MTALLAGALQKTVYDTLVAGPSLAPMINGVYDDAPVGTKPPFVTIGEDTQVIADAQGLKIGDHTLTVHAWSAHAGRSEVKAIGAEIYRLLHETHAGLVLAGGKIIFSRWEWGDTFREQDGQTWHGVQRFRFKVQET